VCVCMQTCVAEWSRKSVVQQLKTVFQVYQYRFKRVPSQLIPAVIEGADNAGPRMKFGRSLKVNKRNSSSLSPLYRT
jgi:hypothetical protein